MKIFKLLFLVLIVQSCAHKPINPTLQNADVNRINEIFRIRSAIGEKVWPGFNKAQFRFVLVDQEKQFAFNVDPLPVYYQTIVVPNGISSEVTSVAATDVYRNEFGENENQAPEVLYAAYSAEQTGMHFKHSIYFVKTLGEYHRIGDKQASEEWVHISLHELFHTYQDQFVKYTPELIKAGNVPFKKQIPMDQVHNSMLLPELKLLGEAACENSLAATTRKLKQALKLRSKRWAYITKRYETKPDLWERYDSWAEGTAHYVEHQIMSRVSAYENESLLKKDQFFQNFDEYKHENQKVWCDRIAGHSKKKYWYSLGFAYALILDKLMPNWKEQNLDSQLFFDVYFKKLGML